VNRPEGEATHIKNTQVGYVLLVDSHSRIRWMATGLPWAGELDALVRGVAKLLKNNKDMGYPDQEPEDLDEPSSL
jgi:hypothetical protein